MAALRQKRSFESGELLSRNGFLTSVSPDIPVSQRDLRTGRVCDIASLKRRHPCA